MGSASRRPLALGLLMIVFGAVLLAQNLFGLRIGWSYVARFGLPCLLLLFGIAKLFRHYTWSEEQIIQYPRRAGLLSGIFFFSVGLLWFLHVFEVVHGIELFASAWPALLILFGVCKVADFYRFDGRLQFRFGELFGVALLALLGLSLQTINRAHFDILDWHGFPGVRLGSRPTFHASQKQSFQDVPAKLLMVDNLYGNVQVQAVEDLEEVQVRLDLEIPYSQESYARELSERIRLVAEREETGLRIYTNRKELGDVRFRTHLDLLLPKGVQVQIRSRFGDVSVTGLDAACAIDAEYGDIQVDSILGQVDVSNRFRAIQVEQIVGDVVLRSERGRVQAAEIRGDVTILNEYESVDVRQIEGNVQVQNKASSVEVSGVQGSLRVEAPASRLQVEDVSDSVYVENSNKPLEVNGVKGELEVVAHYNRVSLEDILGAIRVNASQSDIEIEAIGSALELQNRFGDVSILQAVQPQGPIRVSNQHGAIEVTLPADGNFELRAQAPDGSIFSEFGGHPEEMKQSIRARIGEGGPEVRLETSFGEIQLYKSH